jgi:hypothetical protein
VARVANPTIAELRHLSVEQAIENNRREFDNVIEEMGRLKDAGNLDGAADKLLDAQAIASYFSNIDMEIHGGMGLGAVQQVRAEQKLNLVSQQVLLAKQAYDAQKAVQQKRNATVASADAKNPTNYTVWIATAAVGAGVVYWVAKRMGWIGDKADGKSAKKAKPVIS